MSDTLLQPTLHKPIPLGTRVVTHPNYPLPNLHGKVVGISSMYVISDYIVLLDEPLLDDYGTHEAISVQGSSLIGEDGSSFLLDP